MFDYDKVQEFWAENPAYVGLFYVGGGIFFLLAAVYDWDFLFGGDHSNEYNLKKIGGLINVFGRKPVRISYGMTGVILIILGSFVTWASLKKTI